VQAADDTGSRDALVHLDELEPTQEVGPFMALDIASAERFREVPTFVSETGEAHDFYLRYRERPDLEDFHLTRSGVTLGIGRIVVVGRRSSRGERYRRAHGV
jgi:hypothetical protein